MDRIGTDELPEEGGKVGKNLKCVVVGDGAVGKTCLLMSYATRSFPEDYVPTVFDTYCVSLNVCQSRYQISLFDTAGQEDYRGLRMLSYPSTHVFIVCFSVVLPDSFANVQQKWIPELRQEKPNTPFLLVGTQSDLRDDSVTLQKLQKRKQTPVTIEHAAKVAKKLHAVKYIECSALTRHGLDNVFDEAVLAVIGSGKNKRDSKISKLLHCMRPNYDIDVVGCR